MGAGRRKRRVKNNCGVWPGQWKSRLPSAEMQEDAGGKTMGVLVVKFI